MTSSDIESLAHGSITPESVISRMVEIMAWMDARSQSIDPIVDSEHRRVASHSACGCHYCLVIKRYVKIKLSLRRLERQYDEDRSERLEHLIRRARSDLSIAARAKDLVKTEPLIPVAA